MPAAAAADEHMRCFPTTVQPDVICTITDVAGKRLRVDVAAVLQPLAQISEQDRCQAVCSVAQVIMQKQQQQQGQSFGQPQQQVPVEITRMVLQTLPSMCRVNIPQHCIDTPCNTIT
ncbi:Avenin-like a1 [Hordeum vulgare]|nr:Avenin-like a1 [Hordeum vulgare]